MYLPISWDIARFGQTLPLMSGLIATFGYSRYSGIRDDYLSDMESTTASLLIEQFEDSPNINKVVYVGVDPLQKAEIIANQLGQSRNLDTAYGYALDIAGEILGVDRQGLSDDEYRKLLKLWTFLNGSSGEPESLITALRTFTNATTIHYYESYPAKVYMEFTTIFTPPLNLLKLLQKLAVAGVKILLAWSNDEDPDFAFDGEGIYPPPSNTLGFGETGFPTEGGKLLDSFI
jgi:hypothetical protein